MVVVEGAKAQGGPTETRVTPTFFRTAATFRRWLAKHHARSPELWVGFYHLGSGKGGITYPEALAEALCFGWIDGMRRNWHQSSYVIRFTARKERSNWSPVNLRLAKRLVREKRMHEAGLAAYAARSKSRTYTHETPQKLARAYMRQLKANAKAWDFFETQPPYFKRTAAGWIMSARREETRQRRLDELIGAAVRGQRPKPFILPRAEREAAAAKEGKAPCASRKRC